MANTFGKKRYYREEMDSTNTEAKRQAVGEAFHGLLVHTDHQTMGKGRQGRSWSSPKGTGIFMSLLLKPELAPQKASMLTLIAALSVADAIREMTGLFVDIKWPNDLVIKGRKVCGILTEMSTEKDAIRYVIIGIGMNVNTKEFPVELQQTATSLYIERNVFTDRNALIDCIMLKLEERYDTFIKTGDLEFMQEDYNNRLINCGRWVRVLGRDATLLLEGVAGGINKKGELLVETDDGRIEVCSGEVSVRGIYGYV